MRHSSAGLVVACAVCSMAPGGCSGNQTPPGRGDAAPAPPNAAAPAQKAGEAKKESPAQRKIRYTAQVEVVVKDLDAAQIEVERIIADAGGYVARSEITGSAGTRRTGT